MHISNMRCPGSLSIYYQYQASFRGGPSVIWLNLRFQHSQLTMDLNFQLTLFVFRAQNSSNRQEVYGV